MMLWENVACRLPCKSDDHSCLSPMGLFQYSQVVFFQFNNICPMAPGKIGYVLIARKLTISGKVLLRTTKIIHLNGHKAASNSLLLCTE